MTLSVPHSEQRPQTLNLKFPNGSGPFSGWGSPAAPLAGITVTCCLCHYWMPSKSSAACLGLKVAGAASPEGEVEVLYLE